MVDYVNTKSCKRENYILSRATAIKLNKEFTPYLFGIIRLENFPLYNYRIGCHVKRQLNVSPKIFGQYKREVINNDNLLW